MVNPTLQMGKLRHRQVKHLAQGHITSEQGAGIEPRLSGSRVFASSDSSFLDNLERDISKQLETEGPSFLISLTYRAQSMASI